jgi:hypothetical protein
VYVTWLIGALVVTKLGADSYRSFSVLRFQSMSSMEQDGVAGSTQSGAGQRQLDPQEEVSNYIDLLQVDNTYITTGSEVSCFPFLGM